MFVKHGMQSRYANHLKQFEFMLYALIYTHTYEVQNYA